MRLESYSTTGINITQWMVLKIRFRTLKFYLKNYISCVDGKRKKRRLFAKTYNGLGYAEKEIKRQNHPRVRANFGKIS